MKTFICRREALEALKKMSNQKEYSIIYEDGTYKILRIEQMRIDFKETNSSKRIGKTPKNKRRNFKSNGRNQKRD